MLKMIMVLIFGFYISGVNSKGFVERMTEFSEMSSSRVSFSDSWNASYLKKPIVTRGKLIYIENKRLTKLITFPEKIEQTIIGNKLIIKRGGKTKTIDLRKNEKLATSIYALQYILDGNIEKIQSHFEVSYKESESSWELKIIPISKKSRKEIKSIRITGVGTQISVILISYDNGNTLETKINYGL